MVKLSLTSLVFRIFPLAFAAGATSARASAAPFVLGMSAGFGAAFTATDTAADAACTACDEPDSCSTRLALPGVSVAAAGFAARFAPGLTSAAARTGASVAEPFFAMMLSPFEMSETIRTIFY
jgi:hypothetical protein